MKRKQSQFMLLHEKGALWKQGAFFLSKVAKVGEGVGSRLGNLPPVEDTGGWAYGGTTPPVP